MRALFQFFLVIIFLGITSAFAAVNDSEVTINYLVGTSQIPLAYLILGCILGGSVMTVLLATTNYIKSKVEIRRLKKTLKTERQELSNLRELPVKDR